MGDSSTWRVRDAVPETDAQACLDIYAPFVRDTSTTFEERVPTVEEFAGRKPIDPRLVFYRQ